jgi:DNA-binding MarR family transcriptional regulator
MRPPDGKVFDVLGDDDCREIIDRLLESAEPLTQKRLMADLGMKSSLVSRRMGEIEDAGLATRTSSHAPYDLLFREKVRQLLELGADLASEVADRRATEAKAHVNHRRKRRMRGDGLLDAAKARP